MIPIVDRTTESVYKSVMSQFTQDSVPKSNMVGFATDTTNVMFGEHNSVASLLREENPHIFLMK